MSVVLSLSDVTKVFGAGEVAVRALDGVDLKVEEGELLVVMGPSGSGKTTLLQIAGALLSPTSGQVIVDGRNLGGLSARELARLRAGSVGFVFQGFNLFSSLSAESNVALPLALLPRERRSRRDAAVALLRELGLADRALHLPGELSGGQQQRVAIGRALVNDPRLVLADEPTGNLDSRSGYLVLHHLERLARERGKSVVIVSHDRRMAQVADRVVWLEDGLFGPPPAEAKSVVDPVCGMEIQPDRAAGIRTLPGSVAVWFCSEVCLERFDAGKAGDPAATFHR